MNNGRGSSPHTRGAPAAKGVNRAGDGIIPAYAGSTKYLMPKSALAGDHPRIRGEHFGGTYAVRFYEGSSPHTRGAPNRPGSSRQGTGIIPAYAGSTLVGCATCTLKRDHPRIRGEHRSWIPCNDKSWGSSPHTRGAPDLPPSQRSMNRIIPAYAGSTD